MNAFFVDSGVSTGIWLALKASALLGAAAIVQAALYRRASAATRHHIWMLAVLGVLLLPVMSFVLPDWAVAVPAAPAVADVVAVDGRADMPAPIATTGGLESTPAAPRGTAFPWSVALIGIYAAGTLGMLLHLMVQQWYVRQFARRATVVQDAAWTDLLAECAAMLGVGRAIRLLRSHDQTVPVAFGTRRPSIVVPALADEWADDRRRAVILHEVAHVARYDCLTQLLASVACAMYWFHPAAWWVARRLRIERELACDDRVIAAGTQARDYAGHLLEIAYSVGRRGAPVLAVSMARPRQLEGRMLAVLDGQRDRRVPPFRFRFASAAVAAVVLFPLAVATPTTATPGSSPDSRLERVPTPPAPAAPVQDATARQLKAIEWPFGETLKGLVRTGAGVVGPVQLVQDDVPGTWDIRATTAEGMVRLRLVELNSSSDSTIALAQLEGLTAAKLAGEGPIQFRLRRDAGTFTFDGVLRRGVGAGTFSFAADPNFPAELAKRGFARPTAREQYQLARHDIGYAFVDELNTQRYTKPQTSDLVRAGQHGVQVTYLREMGALGYRLGTLQPLIELRDHGVTPSYVRELAELGYKGLAADEVRRARDHGITPEYVRAMRDSGYGSLPMDALINARDHGITPEFVRGLQDAGHAKLPLDQLIRVRDHGVMPEYVSEMRQLGHSVPIDELVQARDHGVTTEFVREMAALGYGNQSMASLIRLRDHGVTPSYARELKALGYDSLALDDLVMLRDHGMTVDRIRSVNARAGSRLPIDVLKSFAAGGGR
jgi:beta-lactamase regulating signal transducer with metallopeptidase domain